MAMLQKAPIEMFEVSIIKANKKRRELKGAKSECNKKAFHRSFFLVLCFALETTHAALCGINFLLQHVGMRTEWCCLRREKDRGKVIKSSR